MSELCECATWARDIQKMWTNHHANCQYYDPTGDAVGLITELVRAMETWGREEDGIPQEIWEAYSRAKSAIGERVAVANIP